MQHEPRQKGIIRYTSGGVIITPYDQNSKMPVAIATSVKNPVSRKREGFTGFFIEPLQAFCTHYQNPKWLQSQFPDYQIEYDKWNEYDYLEDFELKDLMLTDLQYSMIKAMAETKKNKIFLHMPTGTGKTVTSVFAIIRFYRCKTIIMCYNKKVLRQWWETIKKFSTIDMKKVVILDSGLQLDAIYNNDYDEKDIYLCTPALLDGYGKRHGFDRLNQIYQNMRIGVEITDEAHRRVASTIRISAFTNVRYRIYLSGDYNQTDTVKRKMFYRIFNTAEVIAPSKEVMDTLKFLKCCIVYYTTCPDKDVLMELRDKRTKFINKFRLSEYEYREEMAYHDILYHLLGTIMKTNTTNSKILICSLMVKHVDELYERLKIKYPTKRVMRYHAKCPEEEKARIDEADIIVATYQSFSTGVDIKDIAYAISLDLVDEIEFNQFAGRIRPRDDDKDCWLFILANYGFEFVEKKIRKISEYLNEKKIKEFNVINYKKK